MIGDAQPTPSKGDDLDAVSKARLIYAVVSEGQADEAAKEVMQLACGLNVPPTVQVHPKGGLDDLILPEYATEAAAGWKLGLLVGGGAGLLAGVIAGAMGWVQGLSAGLGGSLGLLSGVLVGALCAVMSGHRRAVAPLREAVSGLGGHEHLLTIDLGQAAGAQACSGAIFAALEARSLRLVSSL